MTPYDWFDWVTAVIWFVEATAGIILRVRRLIRLRRMVLVEPASDDDRDYLASVRRSTYLRLGVKIVLFIGSLIALFNLPLFGVWRIGIIIALGFMLAETHGVDGVRARLGRAVRVA